MNDNLAAMGAYVAGILTLVMLCSSLRTRVHQLESALSRMVSEHDETVSNTEGRYPTADSGCIACTLGTVPNHLNTGLCGYHRARELLGVKP